MKRFLLTAVGCLLLPLVAAVGSLAATYDVGLAPGQIPQLAGVPWGALQPGDIVNINAKPGGYHEIIQISAAGTAAQPILIRGIPDPITHALPVLDGAGAVMDPHVDFRNSVFENLGVILITPRATGYVYGKTFPSYLTIESLEVRNALYDATGALHFTDQHGAARTYDGFACGIYVEFAQHLTIRGCEISFNGNGLFANSKNGAAQATTALLIERNYFHDNGQPAIPGVSNGYHEHNVYVEAVGAVYQYNRFGSLRANCHGCMIKDRSSGTVIRYNQVDASEVSDVFTIADPQGGAGYIDQQPDYRDAFVYGNTITLLNSATPNSGNNLVCFAAFNGINSYATQHRGTLYFYHNTVVNHRSGVGAFFLTDPNYSGSPSILEKVDARNNIFYTDTAIQSNPYQAFHFAVSNSITTIDLGMNWVSPGTQANWLAHGSATIVNGWSNLVVGDYAGNNNAGFALSGPLDYHLTSGSDSIDAAGPLAAAALTKGYTVDQEYFAPQSSTPRVPHGARPDLGAFETSALYTPPALNHAPYALPFSLNLTGPAPVAVTLTGYDPDGDPLTFAFTKSGVVGTLTGRAPNLVCTPPATGTGSMIVGFTSYDGQAVSAPAFIFISFNSPNNPPPTVALKSPGIYSVAGKSTPVTLTATASDPDGISKVEFYVGAKLVGTAFTAPYSVTWTTAIAGRYQVVVKAYDKLNASAYTQPSFISVQ